MASEYDEPIQEAVKRHWADFRDWKYWKAQLYQESRFDPNAISPVGATGLAQFMPKTWDQITKELGLGNVPANHAKYAIDAGAYYMAKLRRGWQSPRPLIDRHRLALASYNAGFGNLLRSQRLCSDAFLYDDIVRCLPAVTGHFSSETITYVQRITFWRLQLDAS